MRPRRTVLVSLAVTAILATTAIPASASHTHVRLLGNGECVILAADSGEPWVQLPYADEFAPDRRHPLHVNVHLGAPGMRQGEPVVWVQGSPGDLANCNGYVNG
jgi:hypothetical protein